MFGFRKKKVEEKKRLNGNFGTPIFKNIGF
jgi:hypothetical protein